MKTPRWIPLFLALLCAAPVVQTAQGAPDAAAERDRAAAERDRQAAEKEMEIARRQLAEAAQKLAAAQRKLSDTQAKNIVRRVVVMEGRPRLGVIVRTTPGGATDALGALIQAVTPGSPAAAAGLRADDIITHFNGEPLVAPGGEPDDEGSRPAGRLVELAGELKDGESVRLGYLRGGRPMTAALIVHAPPGGRRMRLVSTGEGGNEEMEFDEAQLPEIAELPEMPELPGMIVMRPPGRVFDIDLVPMGPDLAAYFGADKGLLVVRAPAGNRLKLTAGDVLLKINGREPAGPPDAVRMLRGGAAPLKLEILRRKTRQNLEISLPPSSPRAPLPPKTPSPAKGAIQRGAFDETTRQKNDRVNPAAAPRPPAP
jgi:membrane-associated protease RseP (regulator of RpoE activity)